MTVPVRDAFNGFFGTFRLTFPEPTPDAVSTVIHEALLTAVQEHPAVAVSDTATVPPFDPKFLLVGLKLYVHPAAAAWVTVRTLPPIVNVAERLDVEAFAATV